MVAGVSTLPADARPRFAVGMHVGDGFATITNIVRSLRGSLVAPCAAVLVGVAISACGGSGGLPTNAVAEVGGTQITKAQLNRWMQIEAVGKSMTYHGKSVKFIVAEPPRYIACVRNIEVSVGRGKAGTQTEVLAECKKQHAQLVRFAMAHLIFFAWLAEEAKERNIPTSLRAAKARLAALKKKQYPTESAFRQYLRKSHYTVSALLLSIRAGDILSPKLEREAKSEAKAPSSAEVAKYYESHKAAYRLPERRTVKVIVTHTIGRANAAKSEIEEGKNFATVARAFSTAAASREKGGLIEELRRLPHAAKLSNAIFSAQSGVFVGPFKYLSSYYVFQVVKVFKPTQQSLRAVEAAVRSTILTPREEAAAERFGTAFRSKWKKRTRCRPGYVTEFCSEYKQATTTTSSTSRATTTSSAVSKASSG